MASNCPNCGKKLKFYHIKAECKCCGANIPNFNWEARLEEDNKIAEAKFSALYKTLNMLRYSIIGTNLRIARLVMAFIPALGFILPWAYFSGDKTVNFDLLGLFTDGVNTIDFFGILFKNIGGIISAMKIEGFKGPISYSLIGFLLVLLSVVVIVLAFFVIFIKFKKPKTNATWITDALSIVIAIAATTMFILSGSAVASNEVITIGEMSFSNATAGALWGIYVYVALLFVALIGNLLVSRADIKSEEQLEAERLERVRIKEEKEEAERLKKEAARAEAQRRAEEEQAEKVRKAKEALAKKNNKQ